MTSDREGVIVPETDIERSMAYQLIRAQLDDAEFRVFGDHLEYHPFKARFVVKAAPAWDAGRPGWASIRIEIPMEADDSASPLDWMRSIPARAAVLASETGEVRVWWRIDPRPGAALRDGQGNTAGSPPVLSLRDFGD